MLQTVEKLELVHGGKPLRNVAQVVGAHCGHKQVCEYRLETKKGQHNKLSSSSRAVRLRMLSGTTENRLWDTVCQRQRV